MIPASLKAALDAEAARTKRTVSSVVTAALGQYLEKPIHTVFQVSTSGALVAGVYNREVSVQAILEHGNFGLGTFANLDGEMVVVDGHVYQTKGTGQVSEAPADAGAPFAVVTWFGNRRINFADRQLHKRGAMAFGGRATSSTLLAQTVPSLACFRLGGLEAA
jgi:hypothetical protein